MERALQMDRVREDELEAVLSRLLPSIFDECKGVSIEEIVILEEKLQQALPDTYVWFLKKMGVSTGPLCFNIGAPRADFSYRAVLSTNTVWTRGRPVIGESLDGECFHAHTRINAQGEVDDDMCTPYASLREYLAWKAVDSSSLFPAGCHGKLKRTKRDRTCTEELKDTLQELGFKDSGMTGPMRTIQLRQKCVLRTKHTEDIGDHRYGEPCSTEASDDTVQFDLRGMDMNMVEDVVANIDRLSSLTMDMSYIGKKMFFGFCWDDI